MKKTEWYPLLPPELLPLAYKAGNELAWPKESALRVIDALETKGMKVRGVDIWIPTNPGPTIPTPFIYDWSSKKAPSHDLYPETAREFVKDFVWDPNDQSHNGLDPVFCISAELKRQ